MGMLDNIFGSKKKDIAHNENKNSSIGPFSDLSRNNTSKEKEEFERLVKNCIQFESDNHIEDLQNCLYSFYSMINKPNKGYLILEYKQKDELALCFAFMIQYDWMHDNDICEVCAWNGFYSIIEHNNHQPYGREGQCEAMIVLFTLLCIGRKYLIPKIQDILNKASLLGNPLFHADDYRLGAQNVIDQISFLAVWNIREMGQKAIPVLQQILIRYNATSFFAEIIKRKDLMKYNPSDIFQKANFVKRIIESELRDM